MTLKELLEKRAEVFARADELGKKETLTDEEARQVDADLEEVRMLDAQIENAEAAEKRSASIAALRDNRRTPATAAPRGAEPGEAEDRNDPVSNPDPQKYSLMRAINCLANRRPVDGYEGEISQEIAKRTGKDPQGFFMPHNLRVAGRDGAEHRDFGTSQDTGTTHTATMPGIIGALRNRMVAFQLGATSMSNLNGTVDLPKQTGTTTAYWVGEATAVTESNPTVGKVTLTPTTVGGFVDITRRLRAQSGHDVDAFVLDDLTRVLSIELDRAIINGSGSGAEPEGILQDSNIATIAVGTNGGAITRDLVLQMERDVAVSNADNNTLSFLTNPKVRKSAKQIDAGTDTGTYLFQDGELEGYPCAISNQVPSNLSKGTGTNLSALIYGDWSTIVVGFWTGVDIMVDPYSLSTQGDTRVVALLDTDIDFRHDEALVKIVDIDTT